MKNFLTITLCFTTVVALGCKTANQTPTNVNIAVATATAAPISKTEMPETQKVEGDFVPSESGTEKAKPETGKANVQGKVLYNEKPVAGVEVKLCEKFNNFIGGCDGESFKTKTDAGGEYLFANVTPRIYEGLLVKVFDTKDYIFATQGYGIVSAKYKIEADKTYFAPETNLFKGDLKIQSPKKNAKADANGLEIKWDAYPDAAYYKLSLSPEQYDADSSVSENKVEATDYKVEKNLKSGEYTLRLSAYNANDVKLSDVEDLKFTVTGDAATNADTK